MNAADLSFENVTVRYPGATGNAVENVTFAVRGGELVVLLGPSGCGKSTLLRTANRLVPLERGRIVLDGTDIAHVDAVELRRTIGYAIQAVGLFSHMTVAQNVATVPSLLGWNEADVRTRVDELLTLVGLPPATYRDRRPSGLSGGEAQRVGVARAIAARPRALLMDEPFGAVDAVARGGLQAELLRIVRALHTTALFVTHDVEEAFRLADRIVVMRAGRIEQIGEPLEMFDAPATDYVRDLIHAGDGVYRAYFLHARHLLRSTA